ncbi:hypothetical protein SDC9_158903 [bioreactor metagenome]|uniref:Uncharacterized protein n=1 Tax=bioreactor metagenome TaxID=1076179 RepID=A0A645FCF8_9ZZZZ
MSRIAAAGGTGGNLGNILVCHVHDAGALRHLIRQREADGNVVIADPCFTVGGKNLLLVFFPVDGDRVGAVSIRRHGDGGLRHGSPPDAPLIDVLGSGKNFFRAGKLRTGQGWVDRQAADVPVVQQVAP